MTDHDTATAAAHHVCQGRTTQVHLAPGPGADLGAGLSPGRAAAGLFAGLQSPSPLPDRGGAAGGGNRSRGAAGPVADRVPVPGGGAGAAAACPGPWTGGAGCRGGRPDGAIPAVADARRRLPGRSLTARSRSKPSAPAYRHCWSCRLYLASASTRARWQTYDLRPLIQNVAVEPGQGGSRFCSCACRPVPRALAAPTRCWMLWACLWPHTRLERTNLCFEFDK